MNHDQTEQDEQALPDSAWVAALLSLPKMGPRRLDTIVEQTGNSEAAWHNITSNASLRLEGIGRDLVATWREAAINFDVADRWAAMAALGISATVPGDANFPSRLLDDPHRPRILFQRGRLRAGPTVGIVGTRSCTAYGQRCAFEFGRELVRAGVSVVSGLALGIDAAAHQGALADTEAAGQPIGVVGSGLDVVYPKRNQALWERVGQMGALISETPPGIKPAAWRFPARNRIIAALSDAVIVVESHERGGSLLTVDEAQLRDVPVGAIPGPITSAAASGTNRLLADGATPVIGVDDIFAMIGFSPPAVIDTTTPESVGGAVLDALGWSPLLFEQLCLRVTLSAAELAAEIENLCLRGVIERRGPWIERVQ